MNITPVKINAWIETNEDNGASALLQKKGSNFIVLAGFPGKTGKAKCEAYKEILEAGATPSTVIKAQKAHLGPHAFTALMDFFKINELI